MPSQTARMIVEKFHGAATKVLATPTLQQRLKQLAINTMPMTPADMDKYVVAELSSNEKLIRAAGIKASVHQKHAPTARWRCHEEASSTREAIMKKLLATLMLCATYVSAFAQTADELLADGKNTENVTTFGMGYDLKMYSPLKQINKSNVKRLVPVWAFSLANDMGELSRRQVQRATTSSLRCGKSSFSLWCWPTFQANPGIQMREWPR